MKKLFLLGLVATLVSGCTQISFPNFSPSISYPSSEQDVVDVFFVMDTQKGLRLIKEQHPKTSNEQAFFQAVKLILDATKPFDPDYVNLWGEGTKVNSLTVVGRAAYLDLADWNLNVGSEGEARSIDQILFTLNANSKKIKTLLITKNGKPIESLAGHIDASEPFKATNPSEVLVGVDIDLEQGTALSNPVRITGVACSFEGNLSWELRLDNAVIDSGTTMAESACPIFGSWEISLGKLNPGTYEIRVWESSAKDSSVVAEDTKVFIVE